MRIQNLFIIAFSCLFIQLTFGQKPLTLKHAEQALQKNNLYLLAEQYNVSVAEAKVIQAKIWEQPYLSGEINALNPTNHTYFNTGANGQKGLAIQQLIYLGGKKKHEVAFAQSNKEIAQLQFESLLRALKKQLSQDFYSLFFNQQTVRTLDTQISTLENLVKAYQVQVEKGNIALIEVVRLQNMLLNFRNDRNEIQKETIVLQHEIQLLTGIEQNIIPSVNDEELDRYKFAKFTQNQLIETAISTNTDYLSAKKITESQELYLKWQKALAIPDLTTGLAYDQRGGAFNNQVNLTFGIPLPLWNKNKGNIKIAEAQINQSKNSLDYKKLEIQHLVISSWEQWEHQLLQMATINNSVTKNLTNLYQGVLTNFEKRNLSIIEFTDFMESYNQSLIQLNEFKKQWILSSLQLNFVSNTENF